MTQQVINVGIAPNDGQGDPIRDAFQKVNNNFTQLFAGFTSNASIVNGNTSLVIPTPGDNIVMTVGSVANVLVVTPTGFSATGNAIITGNANIAGNVNGDRLQGNSVFVTGNITGNYIFGNGAFLTGISGGGGNGQAIINGTSWANIDTLNGNLVINTSGPAWTFDTAGNLALPNGAQIVNLANNVLRLSVDIDPVIDFVGFSGNSIAIGVNVGANSQAANAIAIGTDAGTEFQGFRSIAIGRGAGNLTQGSDSIAIGDLAGEQFQGSECIAIGAGAGGVLQQFHNIAIGSSSGFTGQRPYALAIGDFAGYANQGNAGVAIGDNAGATDQGNYSIAIGTFAAEDSQGGDSVAIGAGAGRFFQANGAVALGEYAGFSDQQLYSVALGFAAGADSQGEGAIAIGLQAGETNQGNGAIAIGFLAGNTNQGKNSIIINATGDDLNQTTANTFTVAPIRNDLTSNGQILFYNTTSKEITYGNRISVTGNITGNYIFGNGSQLTGLPALYGNSNVASFMANYGSNTISTTGNITGAFFSGNGAGLTGVIATGNVGSASQLANGTTSFNVPVVNGNVIGNISGSTNVFVFSNLGANVNGYVNATGNVTGGNIVTTGNVTANAFVGSGAGTPTISSNTNLIISATGNIQVSGNVTATSAISTTGNITGNYILGNGSQLTGLPALYGNSNVATFLANYGSNTISTTGNITATAITASGNVTASSFVGSGAGTPTVSSSSNLIISATGNIQVSGNVTAANTISAVGNIITAANISGAYILGNGSLLTGITANYSNANVATFLANYGSNTISTTGNITGNYFIGNGSQLTGIVATVNAVSQLSNGTTSFNIPVANGNVVGDIAGNANVVVFTGSGANIAGYVNATGNIDAGNVSSAGVLSAIGNVAGGNILSAGLISAAGDIRSGNILTTGVVSATGNITGNFYSGNGRQLTGQGMSYRVTAANNLSYLINGSYANATITLTRGQNYFFEITANSHPLWIKTDPVIGTGNAYSTGVTNNGAGFGTVGFQVPFNAPGTLYYQCQFHTGMYGILNIVDGSTIQSGNSNVQVYANGDVTTSVAGTANVMVVSGSGVNVTGNVSASGNVTGAYILGNGSQLTGIGASYTNNDVATFLASYGSNNISTTGNVTAGFFSGNGAGLTGVVAVGNVGAASQLANGTSSFNIPVSNGNVIGNIGGNTNVFVFTDSGANITGYANVSGDVSAGNVLVSGNVSGTGTNLDLSANTAVRITSGVFRLPSFTTAQLANITGTPGDMVYNTTVNKVQAWQYDATSTFTWVSLAVSTYQ